MSTALEPTKTGTQLTIRDRLNSPEQRAELAKVLPKHLTADRMARTALTAMMRTPKLAECTQPSFFKCLMDLSQWGLEPDGRRAHLIPFENKRQGVVECQLILDYKGIVELCYRSGLVDSIHADVVRRGDLFRFRAGYVEDHVPWFLRDPNDRPESAGDIYAVYCIVRMKSGTAKHDVMSVDDVNAIRDKSQGWYAFKKGFTKSTPWADYWNEMAKKTVFKRCAKWLPWSAEIGYAMDSDDEAIDVDSRPVSTAKRIESTLDSLALEHSTDDGPRLDESESQDGPTPESFRARIEDASGSLELANIEADLKTFDWPEKADLLALIASKRKK